MVATQTIQIETRGFTDVVDITDKVGQAIVASGIRDGIVTVFVPGSTAGVTTIEYEPGAIQDLKDLIERWIPADERYRHDARWGDGNGFSHIRAACMGPSLTVPFRDGVLLLGMWQQVVTVDFDNRPRRRQVVLQIVGVE